MSARAAASVPSRAVDRRVILGPKLPVLGPGLLGWLGSGPTPCTNVLSSVLETEPVLSLCPGVEAQPAGGTALRPGEPHSRPVAQRFWEGSQLWPWTHGAGLRPQRVLPAAGLVLVSRDDSSNSSGRGCGDGGSAGVPTRRADRVGDVGLDLRVTLCPRMGLWVAPLS